MKNKSISFILFSLFFSINYCNAQIATEYSENNYIRYEKGTLPIVISVPHNGPLRPTELPNRRCPRATTVQDTYTMEVGEAIAAALEKFTGKYPNMIYNELARTKLDANRFKEDATCGNEALDSTWEAYHNFISIAQTYAASINEGHVFYIDLHCHGHSIKRLELGYLLRGYDLELSDTYLDTKTYIDKSSIQSLVDSNKMNLSHSELIRGKFALGSLLADRGFPSVPSMQDPRPGKNPYFRGGVNTAMHTSYNKDNDVPGLQIEIDYYGTLSNAQSRALFAESLALALIDFFRLHMDYELMPNIVNLNEHSPSSELTIYPNPLKLSEGQLFIKGISNTKKYSFKFIDMQGKLIKQGLVDRNGIIRFDPNLSQGIYVLSILNKKDRKILETRIILE